MTTYRIDFFEVEDLWGYRNFDLHFDPDVNILIGPNASGKTTLLRLVHSIFSGDFRALQEIDFSEVRIGLRSFDGESRRTLKIEVTESGFDCTISNRTFHIDLEQAVARRSIIRTSEGYDIVERARRGRRGQQLAEASAQLQELVPSVWLPVSRRLPIPEDDYRRLAEFERRTEVDSVDMRLRELSDELTKYRLRLDARLSERYKEFEKRVLGIILYSRDGEETEGRLEPFSTDERNLLLQAFEEAGLLDNRMRKRIEQHFSVAEEVVRKVVAWRQSDHSAEDLSDIEDLAILPLIPRTRVMIEAAQTLEEEREEIFRPLHTYEQTVSSFFEDKALTVLDNGDIEIRSFAGTDDGHRPLPIERLSSGEKQILILLTQAILEQEHPVVYLADEPELSLHVSWQEKLLQSLDILGGRTQIIVATHSPDIVGPFADKVIDLAAKS